MPHSRCMQAQTAALISETGSIAFGKDAKGKRWRAGGGAICLAGRSPVYGAVLAAENS